MLPSESQATVSSGQRLLPQVKFPTAEALQSLPPEDVKMLKQVLSRPAEYVPHELLDSARMEQWLRQPLPLAMTSAGSRPPTGDDSGIYRLTDEPETAPEHQLFLRLNYHRRQVVRILQEYQGKRLSAAAIGELLKWERGARVVRDEIVRQNVPLVLAMARRTRITGVDPADLISEGNMALLRSVEKFDCSRGYRFSTYACRSILKSFSRVATRTSRYRGHFPTEFDPSQEKSHHLEQRRAALHGDSVEELKLILGENLARLSEAERTVIQFRFALNDVDADADAAGKGLTLEEVGEMIGVTKERVRQIQNKALGKLRAALDGALLPK